MAVIRSAVVPGLSLFFLSLRVWSSFVMVFLPCFVFMPPCSRMCFACWEICFAFSVPFFLAINVSGIWDRISRKVWMMAWFRLFCVSSSFCKVL